MLYSSRPERPTNKSSELPTENEPAPVAFANDGQLNPWGTGGEPVPGHLLGSCAQKLSVSNLCPVCGKSWVRFPSGSQISSCPTLKALETFNLDSRTSMTTNMRFDFKFLAKYQEEIYPRKLHFTLCAEQRT